MALSEYTRLQADCDAREVDLAKARRALDASREELWSLSDRTTAAYYRCVEQEEGDQSCHCMYQKRMIKECEYQQLAGATDCVRLETDMKVEAFDRAKVALDDARAALHGGRQIGLL